MTLRTATPRLAGLECTLKRPLARTPKGCTYKRQKRSLCTRAYSGNEPERFLDEDYDFQTNFEAAAL
jgi:hypothetical protein